MPRLQVLAGPSPDKLQPISVNDGSTHDVSSSSYKGRVSVHLKGYQNENGDEVKDTYFDDETRREDHTWSIQWQGKFTEETNGDSLLFGTIFDHKVILPWGFSAAMSVVSLLEPTITHDLYSETPWTFAPLLSSMPYISRERLPADSPLPSFPSTPMKETPSTPALSKDLPPNDRIARKTFFRDPTARENVSFTTEDVITADYCHGYLSFPSLNLDLPGGISFDLKQYDNGQPIKFVLAQKGDGPYGTAKIYFCVAFDLIKDDDNGDDDTSSATVESEDID